MSPCRCILLSSLLVLFSVATSIAHHWITRLLQFRRRVQRYRPICTRSFILINNTMNIHEHSKYVAYSYRTSFSWSETIMLAKERGGFREKCRDSGTSRASSCTASSLRRTGTPCRRWSDPERAWTNEVETERPGDLSEITSRQTNNNQIDVSTNTTRTWFWQSCM